MLCTADGGSGILTGFLGCPQTPEIRLWSTSFFQLVWPAVVSVLVFSDSQYIQLYHSKLDTIIYFLGSRRMLSHQALDADFGSSRPQHPTQQEGNCRMEGLARSLQTGHHARWKRSRCRIGEVMLCWGDACIKGHGHTSGQSCNHF